jgi:hypothetical protein
MQKKNERGAGEGLVGVDRPGLKWRLGKKGKFIQPPEEIKQATPGFFCLLQAYNICFFFVALFFFSLEFPFFIFPQRSVFAPVAAGCVSLEFVDEDERERLHGETTFLAWFLGQHLALCLVSTYAAGCEAFFFLVLHHIIRQRKQ